MSPIWLTIAVAALLFSMMLFYSAHRSKYKLRDKANDLLSENARRAGFHNGYRDALLGQARHDDPPEDFLSGYYR